MFLSLLRGKNINKNPSQKLHFDASLSDFPGSACEQLHQPPFASCCILEQVKYFSFATWTDWNHLSRPEEVT